MLTERFYRVRKKELDKVFSKQNIAGVWRKVVKDQLRRTDILDIFDHYDFNYNIDERAILLRNDLLDGNYQCSLPLIYRIEKKYGICRHLIMPQPIDALRTYPQSLCHYELENASIFSCSSLNSFGVRFLSELCGLS
jgi:hypothetical protein